MPVELTHPWFLLLALPGAALLAWVLRRSLADLTPRQRTATLLVRALLLGCVLLALAGVRLVRRGDDLGVVFLVDDSASVSATARDAARNYVEDSLKNRRSHDEAGVLGFACGVSVWQPPAASSALAVQWPATPDAERAGTDIGRALEFAASVLPAGRARRVVLLSDGNDTSAAGRETAARLAAGGAEVLTVPLRNPAAPEVLVAAVDVPRGLKSGEPFDLHADLESNVATTATVRLYQNQFLVATRENVPLHPGRNDLPFPNLRAGDGFTAYEVEILPAADTRLENNRAGATVALGGNPRVLLVDGDETKAAPLAGALREAKIEVETRGPAGLPRTLGELQRFDLFLLSDVSALSMTRDQTELYRTWVQQFGGGFVMIGGENSFGVGGYFRTPIEQMLPVRMDHDDRQETPSVALYVILDRSGSMTAPVSGNNGATKMSLADQGAVLAMNVLQGRDLFGLTAVDVQVNPVVPLARLGNKAANEQKILAVTAGGGGIYIYTSLADAVKVMHTAQAKIKHVILFSDAADAEEKNSGEMPDGAAAGRGTSLDLVSALLADKVTTSVVGLGTERDKDVTFLRSLAERGNGRFYLTADATTLPQIFSTETMKVAQSSLVEEPFNPVPAAPSALTSGIDWASCPPLLGYNSTKPKPTAQILLATELGEPLLATWRYGLGQTAAFTRRAGALGRRMAAVGWVRQVLGAGRPGALAQERPGRVPGPCRGAGRRPPAAAGHRRAHAGGRLPRPPAHRHNRPGHRHRRDAPGSRRTDRAGQLLGGVRPARAGRRHRGDDDVLGVLARVDRPALRLRPHALVPARVPAHGYGRGVFACRGGGRQRAVRPLSHRDFCPADTFFDPKGGPDE